jgi:hypothetical protein
MKQKRLGAKSGRITAGKLFASAVITLTPNQHTPMKEERAITVSVEIQLNFEVERMPQASTESFDIGADAAIADLRAYLARYSGGRVLSINRNEQTDGL